jgi:hypothetical protein
MTTTADVVRLASPRFAEIGPGFYFTEQTLAVGREHGLDGFRFYFLGRGGMLGDVEAAVVASAFGYFRPELVERMWTTARERAALSPREAGRLYLRCAREHGRRYLSEVGGLAEYCAAAQRVIAAADPAGLALYAGVAAEPLPEDLPARAMQLAVVLREFRRGAHLLAVRATPGVDPKVAHALRRPNDWTMFGYGEAERPADTEARRSALAAADELTDQLVAPAYDVLDQAGRGHLLDGLEAMAKALPERIRPDAP